MNKKLVIAYLLSAVIVGYAIYAYSTRQADPVVVNEPTVAEIPLDVELGEVPISIDTNASKEELIAQYTQQIKQGNDKTGVMYYRRGLVYLELQQYRIAILDFTNALRITPNAPGVLYARALAYKANSDLVRAVTDLTAAIKLKADFAAAYNTRAVINESRGLYDEAINDYKNAIAISPNFDQAYFNLGVLYAQQKQYAAAIQEFSNAIAKNTVVSDADKQRLLQAYTQRATMYLLEKNLNAALSDANYVVEQDPKSEAAYRLRADIYLQMGNNAGALADQATADTLSMQNLLEQR